MPLKGVSVAKASKLISDHVESVTCLECCKYYLAPERATCGHTLCHTCWRGRRVCPACAVKVNRRSLKFDAPLQSLTEKVTQLVESFEQFVGVKMDEFMMESPVGEKEPEDPTKNVKEWLISSDNHFSAPPFSDTQQSPQELPNQILLSTSKIQIHNPEINKSLSPPKVVHVPGPQDDWDNIEVVDSEDICSKRKESIAGPMDLEPFDIDDNLYSNENPRRSSRKRENNDSKGTVSPNKQTDKHTSCNSNAENDKKLDKAKQNWAQVKKMKKEFSKLNKVNKNKLNISIEMCKKTQSVTSKQKSATPIANDEEMVIDDNTPDLIALQQKNNEQDNLSNKENMMNNTQKDENEVLSESVLKNTQNKGVLVVNEDLDVIIDKYNELVSRKSKENNKEDTEQIPNTFTEEEKQIQHKPKQIQTTEGISLKQNESTIKIPFFKKVPILDKSKIESTKPDTNDINIPSNTAASDDDIHITIRIGDVVTNITINKKQNDVQLKVNRNREVQTSTGSITSTKTNIEKPVTKDMEVQTNTEPNKGINSATQVIQKKTQAVLEKSVSTRKNTASAETATAQFEITESVEKELSKIMECQDENEIPELGNTQKSSKSNKSVKKNTQTSLKSKANQKNLAISQGTENPIPEDLELEDIDIFNSGSVKEQNVQLLKTTKCTQSEILLPTNKTNKTKTQKKKDKRNRDLDDEDVIEVTNKRQKTDTQDIRNDQFDDSIRPKDKTIENESTNYDEVMGQVFANIDADIQESQVQKTSQAKRNSQVFGPNVTQRETELQVMKSQAVQKAMTEKYSENMFSTAGNMLEKGNTHVPGPETQLHIENLLTPGMCEDLASSQVDHGGNRQADSEVVVLGTPVDHGVDRPADSEVVVLGTPVDEDDSDKSVVEETPQKNKTSSLTKSKSRTDSGNRTVVNVKSLQLIKPSSKVDEQRVTVALTKGKTLDSQDIGSIINLTDSIRESAVNRGKDSVVRDPMKALETPLTINRFVNQIKHNSTPVARKSLNFTTDSIIEDDVTLCPAKTTQEKEFMTEAFENKPNTPVKRPLAKTNPVEKSKALCIAGSCLTSAELTNLKVLCFKQKWTFADKYTQDLTHLVVSVDEDFRAQRSVKYMCALAAGKWIVAYEWVKKCLETNAYLDELSYEAQDSTGDPGPHRSRVAGIKLFDGITFYCMPPFSVLDVGTLESMLTAAGGRVVHDIAEAVVVPEKPSLLLAEPEHTQEDRFLYLAMQHSVVPVNFEWALNCLGGYTLLSVHELLLCPATILSKTVKRWRIDLLSRDDDD